MFLDNMDENLPNTVHATAENASRKGKYSQKKHNHVYIHSVEYTFADGT